MDDSEQIVDDLWDIAHFFLPDGWYEEFEEQIVLGINMRELADYAVKNLYKIPFLFKTRTYR